MNNKSMGKTVLLITLIVVVAVIVLKLVFDIDALELFKGFISWLFELIWGNRIYRKG